jgi:thioesterase domain-containing protein
MDGEYQPHKTIDEIARYNIKVIQSVQPEGPYFLGGMCFGAVVAFEMAHQLINLGQDTAFVGLFDARNIPAQKTPFFARLVKFFININKTFFQGKIPFKLRGLDLRMNQEVADDSVLESIYNVFETHAYAHLCYTSPPLPATLTLFMTEWKGAGRMIRNWQQATKNELDVVIIPGVHGPYDVKDETDLTYLDEPHIQEFARLFTEKLEEVENLYFKDHEKEK